MSELKLYAPQGLLDYDPDFPLDANCFAYSLGIPNLQNEEPGFIQHPPPSHIKWTKHVIHRGLIRDGLRRIYEHASSKTPIIAIFSNPGKDYHCYRKHPNGTWSHSFIGTKAFIVDNAGEVIINPLTAAKGVYREFVGFYNLPNEGIMYCARECAPN